MRMVFISIKCMQCYVFLSELDINATESESYHLKNTHLQFQINQDVFSSEDSLELSL